MPLEFIQSQKGKQLLVLEGCSFEKNVARGDTTYWRCSENARSGCSAKCVTVGDNLKSQSGAHNHTADAAQLEKRQRLNILKESARNTTDAPAQIVASSAINMPKSVAGMFPTPKELTHTIQRTRKIDSCAPANPSKLADLVFPPKYTKTFGAEDFLLFDSGQASDRILLFSTSAHLETLSQCEHWYADGTFKSSPPLFTQVFTVHGVKSEKTLPLVYGLLPDKQEATYTRFFSAMNRLGHEAYVRFRPTSVLTDFEFGSMNAVKSIFPRTELRGCYFHHTQCIWKHVQQCPAILNKYNTDPDFALHLRQLAAIAFVPVPAVRSTFETLMDTPFFEENEQLLQPLIQYYQETWMGYRERGVRRNPLFPHELWNCHHATADQNSRTNNAVEGWHRRFNSRIGMAHPTIWKFVEKIQEEQSVVEMQINQIVAGTPTTPRRKKYRQLDARLLRIVENYDRTTVYDYLLGIAQNIAFYV